MKTVNINPSEYEFLTQILDHNSDLYKRLTFLDTHRWKQLIIGCDRFGKTNDNTKISHQMTFQIDEKESKEIANSLKAVSHYQIVSSKIYRAKSGLAENIRAGLIKKFSQNTICTRSVYVR